MTLQKKSVWVLAVSALLLGSCANDSETVSAQRTGRFLDSSAVQGLAYRTLTQQGETNADGEFTYIAGEQITFSLGDVQLPTIQARTIITAVEVFGATDADSLAVVNLSRLLQSLDIDGDSQNGITLSSAAIAAATGLIVDFSSTDFDAMVINLVANSGSNTIELIAAATANMQLQNSLIDNGLVTDGCTSDHPFVGRRADFVTLFHGVSGSLRVVDDCTLEITEFNYDGGGPSVFFYAGRNRMFRQPGVFVLGPQLDGQVYVNDSFRLSLPDGQSLDDFDSISVWCFEFSANFGDVYFGDP